MLSTLETPAGTVTVVRDDLLPGGTKQRALAAHLTDIVAGGARSVVYASPAPGFAQVALAYVCRRMEIDCVLFCQQLGDSYHEFSLLARSYGATIEPCATLALAEKAASAYRDREADCVKLPLGFGDTGFIRCLRATLRREWAHITNDLGYTPERVWLPVGSGTFARAMLDVLPEGISLTCVDVGVLDPADARVHELADLPGVSVRRASEAFLEPCAVTPPVPSNTHYDAKLWPLIQRDAANQDLWWNVAR
ncbi:pyridoxal-phosphate dependent enzyme [Herbihabitans rhizosphaerae]|uniref:pyridoxal-phosphate dependent enzyme n=1 Tax=Herbihabitans rhizosphaerae TaxID=1872711 RepID=UPI0013EED8C2|nr:pyridoxal-phosphate dependent enzyme [Herbihabitans rhizosphaerae]